MGIELLIYSYGAICLAMIVFNCVCMMVFRQNDRRMHRKSRGLEQKIAGQMMRLTHGKTVSQQHIYDIYRKLTRIPNLMALNACLSRFYLQDAAIAKQYLYEIQPVFVCLAKEYLKKERMQAAYFAYFISKHYVFSDETLDTMLEYLKIDSLYCRQNAMRALYNAGDARRVMEGIRVLDGEAGFFHSKILSDGLLTFTGDHAQLIALLWEEFETLSVDTQVAILNYIRFKSGAYCDKMLEILTDASRDKELRYAAIRYFGRYTDERAYPVLLQFVRDSDEIQWNFSAFSAVALASYPGAQTIEVLKAAVHSSNWYIRYNVSQSLEALGVSYQDMMDIMSGDDRYAREMMAYRFDSRAAAEEALPV